MQERMTEQKRIVIETLEKADRPLAASELHSLVLKDLPQIAPSTVFRILDRLVATGKATRSTDSEGVFLFYFASHHTKPLIFCTSCHKLFPVTGHAFEKVFEQLAKATGFLFPEAPVQFPGICPACQSKKAAR